MLCAISGEAPQVPVVSLKSGNVYEKRLIESYISENGTEPTTNEALTVEDLLDVKSSQTVRPRPPTLTSIPALLSVFQEEWDALSLQTFTLQQNLAQTRQELSTALYQHDAAVRVIARLTQERDEAREALSKINITERTAPTNGANGDAMQVDNAPLPDSILTKIDITQQSLTKTRRKRPVPEDWATSDAISSYKPVSRSEALYPGASFLSVNNTGESILLGGADGITGVYSISEGRITQSYKTGKGAVTAGLWADKKAITATTAGDVKVFEGQSNVASFQVHSANVSGLTLHPSGDILASVSEDKSFVLYDIESSQVLTQVFADSELTCAQFHPDGHLLAAGGSDGLIRFFDVKSGILAGTFDTGEPLKALFFSENGTWVAAATVGSPIVGIWDLRKVGATNEPIKAIDTGSPVESLFWDYTAQFLLVGGHAGVSVQQYTKSTKEWSEPLRLGLPANAVAWGHKAQSIMIVNSEGVLTVVGSA